MSQVVNNTDKLAFILTSYGLGRIAEALVDKTVTIMLTKIKVGDANFEYYTPSEFDTELKHPIEDGEFYIIEKDLLEDKLTISLHALIPENFSNCEIREIGIYETVDGEDKLFAISTQQPLLKPSTDLNYFIAVDYFAFLKSANLAEIYDQIILDPDTQAVTKEDFENLMMSIAFTEGNLMEQINGNSRVIGLNRAQQLAELIAKSQRNLTATASLNLYTLLLDFCEPEDVYSYWLFDYTRRNTGITSISDISEYGRNLNTNKATNLFERVSHGLTSMLKFTKNDSFSLPQADSITKFNRKQFTYVGSIEVNEAGKAEGFSRSDYISLPSIPLNSDNVYSITFNFRLDSIDSSQVILSSGSSYVLTCYYDFYSRTLTVKLGDGMQWHISMILDVVKDQEYTCRVLFNKTRAALQVMENGTFKQVSYASINYNMPLNLGTILLGCPIGDFGALSGHMQLMPFSVRENDRTVYSGSTYATINNLSFINADGIEDDPFVIFYSVEPLETGVDRTIMARVDKSTNTAIFDFTETADNALRIRLYEDSSNYVTFTSAPNSIPTSAHVVGINYHADTLTVTAYVNGNRINFTKEVTGSYNHMNNDITASLYAFTHQDVYNIYANSVTAPSTLYNEDGSTYEGTDWTCNSGHVLYSGEIAKYTGNEDTDTLYCWLTDDGLDEFRIYTKTLSIQENTVLYNEDYSVYEGEDFKVEAKTEDVNTVYVVTYVPLSKEMDYNAAGSKPSRQIYRFTYEAPLQMIWTNNPEVPTVLYDENGVAYTGEDWYLEDYKVHYKNGDEATYNSLYNIIVPSIPLTSYITNSVGKPENPLNSNIGLLCVVRKDISDRDVRALVINLDANIGNNPCIKER